MNEKLTERHLFAGCPAFGCIQVKLQEAHLLPERLKAVPAAQADRNHFVEEANIGMVWLL